MKYKPGDKVIFYRNNLVMEGIDPGPRQAFLGKVITIKAFDTHNNRGMEKYTFRELSGYIVRSDEIVLNTKLTRALL